MDKNYIVELIKDNRLQDAIKALEAASKDGDLKNDLISISASYAEYARLNRTAAEDHETLSIQRARITNRLLSVLDEFTPEQLEAAPMPKITPRTEIAIETTPRRTSNETPSFLQNKPLLYGIGGVLALLIIIFLVAGGSGDADTATPNGTTETSHPSEQSVQNNPNQAQTTSNNAASLTNNVGTVEYHKGSSVLNFIQEGNDWIEDGKFRFKEVSHNATSIFLRDDSRNMNLEFDLAAKQIKMQDKNGVYKFLYPISHFE